MPILLRALLLTLAVTAAHAADIPAVAQAPAKRVVPLTEEDFRRQTMLGDYTVVYQDHLGNKLTYDEFSKRMTGGMSMHKEPGTHEATAKLADPDAPKSMPKSNFKVKAGDALPDFQLVRLDGSTAGRQSLLGKPTLINFMFANCAPCVQEVPELNALAAAHPELNFAAVTFDDLATAKEFSDKYKFAWTMLAQGRPFLDTLGVKNYPSFALIAADGTILGTGNRAEIARGDRTLEAWIARLLAPAAKS
jgi:thiol-disulfide isomerase/thioredoxin